MLSTIHWIAQGGGDWNTKANWEGNRLPAPGDDVVIDVPSSAATISFGSTTTQIKSLDSNEALQISGGTLDVQGGALRAAGGLIFGVDNFTTASGTLANARVSADTTVRVARISSGVLSGVVLDGTLDLKSNATFQPPFPPSSPAIGNNLAVKGSLTLNGTAFLGDNGTFPNMTFGVLNFQGSGAQLLDGTGSIVFGSSTENRLNIANNTTLTVGPGLTVHGGNGTIGRALTDTSASNVQLINQGHILGDVPFGLVHINVPTWSNAGEIRASSGNSIWTHGSWSSTGTLGATGGSLLLDGTFSSADVSRLSGSATSSSSGTSLKGIVDNTGRSLAITAAMGPVSLSGGTIRGGTISTDAGIHLVADQNDSLLDGVTVDGTLDVLTSNGRSLSFINGLTVNGTVNIGGTTQSGRLAAIGSQSIGGAGSIVFGPNSQDEIRIPDNSTLTLNDGATIRGNRGTIGAAQGFFPTGTPGSAFINKGTVQADVGGGSILLNSKTTTNDDTGRIKALGGGTIDVRNALTGTGEMARVDGSLLLNSTVTSSSLARLSASGTGTTSLGSALANTGSTLALTSASGSLTLASGTIVGGAVTTSGGALVIVTGSGTLDGVAVGDINVGTASLTVKHGLTLNGTISVGTATAAGRVNFSSQADQSLAGTGTVAFSSVSGNWLSFDVDGGTLTIGEGITLRGGNFTLGQQTVPLNTTIRLRGVLDSGGGLVDVGTVTFDNQGTVLVNGGRVSVFASHPSIPTARLLNYGAGKLTGGLWRVRSGLLTLINGPITTNASQIELDGLNAKVSLDTSGSNGALSGLTTNAPGGYLRLTNGASLTTGALVNQAFVVVDAGAALRSSGYTGVPGSDLQLSAFAGPSQVVMTGGATFRLDGGALEGTGSVSGSVVNNGGLVAPGLGAATGVLTVSGSYTQTASGQLYSPLAGAVLGAGYSRLAVAGSAALNGTFATSKLNGYVPAAGTTFQPLTFGSRSGAFASYQGLDDGTDPFLVAALGASNLTLRAANANTAPTLAPIADQSGTEGSPIGFTASGSDTPGDTLTYLLVGAPAGAVINPSTGVFSWTPGETQDGIRTFTVRVTDDGVNRDGTPGQLSADRTFTITVAERNTAPSLATIAAQSAAPGAPLTFVAQASDPDIIAGAPDVLAYSLSGNVPAGAAIDPSTGVFTWTPAESDLDATFTFNVDVSDGEASATRAVTVAVGHVAISGQTLYVSGSSADDFIEVTADPSDAFGKLIVKVNGITQGTYARALFGANGVVILGLGGNDTIQAETWSTFITLDGGAGADTYRILEGQFRRPLSIDDTGPTGQDTATLESVGAGDSMTLATLPLPEFPAFERVVYARGVENGHITQLGGDSSVSVQGWAGLSLSIELGDGQNSVTLVAGKITGSVQVTSHASGELDGRDFLDVFGSPADDTFVLDGSQLTVAGASSSTIVYGGFENLNLYGYEGDDTFTVHGTSTGVGIDGGAGSDTTSVELGGLAPIVLLDPNDPRSHLNAFSVNDSGTGGNDSVTFIATEAPELFLTENTYFSVGNFDAPTLLPFYSGGFETIRIDGRGGDDRFVAAGSPSGTLVTDGGDGSDTYIYDQTGNLNGPAVVADSGVVGVDDIQMRATAATMVVESSSISAIFGPTSTRTLGYSGVETIELPGFGATRYDVNGSGASVGLVLRQAGVYTDGSLNSTAYTVRLGNLAGPVSIVDTDDDSAPIHDDRLTVLGSSGDDRITLDSTTITLGNPAVESIVYHGIENLTVDGAGGNDTIVDNGSHTTLLGGPGDDEIVVNAAAPGSTLALDGGEGSDRYTVHLGRLASPVVIADTGAGASDADALAVVGTTGDDVLLLTSGGVTSATESVSFGGATLASLSVDGDGGTDSLTPRGALPTISVATINIPPSVDAGGPGAAIEGTAFDRTASFFDASPGTLTVTVDYGDDSLAEQLTPNPDGTVDLHHVYAVQGEYTLTLVVADDPKGVGTGSALITVANAPPVVTSPADQSADEGTSTSFLLGSFLDTIAGDGPWTVDVAWGDGGSDQVTAGSLGSLGNLAHTFAGDGVYVVRVIVADRDGASDDASFLVTVHNVTPGVAITGPSRIKRNESFIGGGSFTDPGADTWTATVDYGDGGGIRDLELDGKSFALEHFYGVDGEYTITVSVSDGVTVGMRAFVVTVKNVAPVVTFEGATIDEGSVWIDTGSFTDPDESDTWTASVDYGDGSGPEPLALGADKVFDFDHRYGNDGEYTVSVMVSDGTDAVSFARTITVRNFTPLVDVSDATVPEGAPYAAAGAFTDPGDDAWSATVDYGDGSGVQSLMLEADRTFALDHRYAHVGSYQVTVAVRDDDGEGTATFEVRVVDITPPAVTAPDLAATSDTGLLDDDNITSAAIVVLGGTAEPGSTVTLTRQGSDVPLGTVEAVPSPGLWGFSIGGLAEGTYLLYATATDAAGNSRTSQPLSVVIDRTAPVVIAAPTVGPASTGWYNGDTGAPVVHFSATDAGGSGVDLATLPADRVLTAQGENVGTSAAIRDIAGNVATASVAALKVDTLNPTISGAPDRAANSAGWYRAPVTVSFSGADAGGSGVATLTSPIVLGEGAYPNVVGTVVDRAGNRATATVKDIRIDQTAPLTAAATTGTAGTNGWFIGAVDVTLNSSDDRSGVAATSYTVDGGPERTYTGKFNVSSDGSHTIRYWSVDQAGNVEVVRSLVVRIDATPPTVLASADKTTLGSPNGKMVPVTVTGAVVDQALGSGLMAASFAVIDEYGVVQPSGAIALGAGGTFTFVVNLEASRNAQDKDGRSYQIVITALDVAGNRIARTITVTVPHDQGKN